MSRGDIILRLVNVTRTYITKDGMTIGALKGVTTSFKRGEFVAVVGKSGSGKSTLINILGGLDTPTSGDYFLEGNNIAYIKEGQWDAIRNEKIGFIFQEYHLVEYLSVYKNIEIALKYQNTMNAKMKDAKVKNVLEEVGILEHMHKLPTQLSGGQRQRVAIARALVKDPDIILADEPTGALDSKTSETIIELIKGLSKERLVIVVTHDRGIAEHHATRMIELDEGRFASDLIKEDIPQTYQNVYKKTKPTNLSLKDKLELTFSKIKSQFFRTFFTALSLALAFAFVILFNGIQRGVTDAYDAYYEALNKGNTYSFTVESIEDITTREAYLNAVEEINTAYENTFYNSDSSILMSSSTSMAYSLVSGGVERVGTLNTRPDLLSETKLRLLDVTKSEDYSYQDLFLAGSGYPYDFNELMVTSKFVRDYYSIPSNIIDLDDYIGETIQLPIYTFDIYEGIYNVDEFLLNAVELEDGSVVIDDSITILPAPIELPDEEIGPSKIRYLDMNMPYYCYDYDELDTYYQNVCDTLIEDDRNTKYFNTIEEYIEYMNRFKEQVNVISPDYFDILRRSNAIFYMVDENEQLPSYEPPGGEYYITRVYRALYDDALSDGLTYFEEGIFTSLESTKTFYISAIIENTQESIIHMDYKTYETLFDSVYEVEVLPGYITVHLENGIQPDLEPIDVASIYFATPLNNVSTIVMQDFQITRQEYIEQGDVCAIYNVDNILVENPELEEVDLLGDVFTITDYSGCKVDTQSYQYLNSIKVLFGVFFNTLMIISIVFFNILLQVMLKERIGEIGIYRSVGSTSKDIKRLFYIEIVVIVLISGVIASGMIYGINELLNQLFVASLGSGSGVIRFAGMTLSISDSGSITNISFFNLAFYIVVVLGLLTVLSNRNVSRVAETKPIDILREGD
jgi:putative ABC transport system permease protein